MDNCPTMTFSAILVNMTEMKTHSVLCNLAAIKRVEVNHTKLSIEKCLTPILKKFLAFILCFPRNPKGVC